MDIRKHPIVNGKLDLTKTIQYRITNPAFDKVQVDVKRTDGTPPDNSDPILPFPPLPHLPIIPESKSENKPETKTKLNLKRKRK